MKIMIVDDEPLILNGLIDIVNNEFKSDVEVLGAFDGIDALEKLGEFQPELIITDIHMPELNGLQMIEQMLKQVSNLRFIILSGYADFEYARQALQFKAIDYILKPVNKEKFIGLLLQVKTEMNMLKEAEIRQEIMKIKEILFYDVPLTDSLLEENVLKLILPFPFLSVILLQGKDELQEINNYEIEQLFSGWFEKYYIFPLPHKKQVLILNNFSQMVPDYQMKIRHKELSIIKRTHSKITDIGISPSSDRIDTIHSLYNSAIRDLTYIRYVSDRRSYLPIGANTLGLEKNQQAIKELLDLTDKEAFAVQSAAFITAFLDQSKEDIHELRIIFSIMIADITIYLQNIGFTFEEVLGKQNDIEKELDTVMSSNQLKITFQMMLTTVFDYFKNKEMPSSYSESISRILDYINQNYMQDISLESVAELVNLHPNYASSLFKKELGTTFLQYLNSHRITQAKGMMKKDQFMSFEKIAELVGFHNIGNFFKVFKKYNGITPGEYRSKRDRTSQI